jgi:hypothetical protein
VIPMQKKAGKIFSNWQFGMTVHTKLVIIMELSAVNFATSKNLVVKRTMFPHPDIHKYTCTTPEGKTRN